MMRQEYYPDRIYGFDEYATVARRRKAENEAKKRSRKEKNDKNRQKQGQNGLFRVAFEQNWR